ncbi:alpha-(1,3)-fucosyltransferase 5-like [Trichechus manatus latirostris]|uniref:3-galactosyl-N-acetylglucosaminide 4-alpha-L-fucosyltransferase n=1 Tax=Trichechus manatus latirostris TaxID=127582 RepID=A0A2Y9DPR2_TRIMA|nr:alpha-(1,3)-fucosyltransferase 5-like [Trichechus manatus latirostris]
MDPIRWAKVQYPWRHCLSGLLFQLLLALCLFSYLRVAPGKPPTVEPLAQSANESSQFTPRHPSLVVLLWTWPFNVPVHLSRCSRLRPGTADCQLTANRGVYRQADAVIVHHREVSSRPLAQLPPSPRPPGQRWVWFSLESPSHCRQLKALDGYFNLTMSYRSDSDIFTPHLQALDKDQAAYLRYFRWRETLRPCSRSWAQHYCEACWRLQQEPRYQAVPSIASWFT